MIGVWIIQKIIQMLHLILAIPGNRSETPMKWAFSPQHDRKITCCTRSDPRKVRVPVVKFSIARISLVRKREKTLTIAMVYTKKRGQI